MWGDFLYTYYSFNPKSCSFFTKKFIYSEKATKFYKISTLLLSLCTVDKSKVENLQHFVAFSEYTNFIKVHHIQYVKCVTNKTTKYPAKVRHYLFKPSRKGWKGTQLGSHCYIPISANNGPFRQPGWYWIKNQLLTMSYFSGLFFWYYYGQTIFFPDVLHHGH